MKNGPSRSYSRGTWHSPSLSELAPPVNKRACPPYETLMKPALFSIGAFYAPPKDANPWVHVGVLLGGLVILGGAPLVIHRFQRPSWRADDDSHFPPDNLRQQELPKR